VNTLEDQRLLEVLDDAECRRLLGGGVIGRLAFTENALPAIQPVHYVLHGGRVLIPTGLGTKVAAASRGAVVAFEVDDFDVVARTGWNVTVVGASHVISDPAGVAELDALGARAWAPTDQPCYVAVEMAVVRGRRISVLAPPVDALADVPVATGAR